MVLLAEPSFVVGADRGGRGADHRVPVRDGSRGADGGDGGERPRRGGRRADQGRRAARAAGRRRHRGLRQDRHAHRRHAEVDGMASPNRARMPQRSWRTSRPSRAVRTSAREGDRRIRSGSGSASASPSIDSRPSPARGRAASVDGIDVIVGTEALLDDVRHRRLGALADRGRVDERRTHAGLRRRSTAAAVAVFGDRRRDCAQTRDDGRASTEAARPPRRDAERRSRARPRTPSRSRPASTR